MSNKTLWQHLIETNGLQAAFDELLQKYEREQKYHNSLASSRFYMKLPANSTENAPARLISVPESRISMEFDMADCCDPCEFLWMDDDFNFHPVSCRNPGSGMSMGAADEWQQENPRSVLSWGGDLIANGQIVGSVTFTDH
jgi:hypothetical protein